jgi:hypothetical protein
MSSVFLNRWFLKTLDIPVADFPIRDPEKLFKRYVITPPLSYLKRGVEELQ